jgi:ABC-type lipoprotein export system ATPase subunit
MASASPLLKLVQITKRYASPDGASPLVVLKDISLQIGHGESFAIVGPSGSGKSTLLQIIGTLDQPTSGQVLLDSQDIGQLDERRLAAVRNRQIGFVFQAHYLLPQCTVLENVLIPTLVQNLGAPASSAASSSNRGRAGEDAGAPRESVETRATRLLARVGLGERLSHRPGQLSGGERQRVAVVRALINGPKLLLADEPTGALDHAAAQSLGQLLGDLNREEGVTLIVVTHSSELAQRMKRVLELKDGQLVCK